MSAFFYDKTKEEKNMGSGRPKGGRNKKYSFEEKLRIVKIYMYEHKSYPVIEREEGVAHRNIERWVKAYLQDGKEGLKSKNISKRGNHFSALYSSKSLSNEERLKLENMKLRIENERLKKGYLVEGDGAKKEYVSIYDKIMKSSKN